MSDLILEVLEEANRVALREARASAAASGRLGIEDDAFRKASQEAVIRFRRIHRLRVGRNKPPR